MTPPRTSPITIVDILHYEVNAAWWTPYVSWKWGIALTGKYFAWKVSRKWRQFQYRAAITKHLSTK